MLLRYCLSDFEMVPVPHIITGITFAFTFHVRWISITRSLHSLAISSVTSTMCPQNGRPLPRHKPWDTPATLLLPHAPSPGGSLLLPLQGISSGSPGCCGTFGTPCPPKQPTVHRPGFWGLHAPKANSRHCWRPEGSSAATPESS